MEDSFSRYFRVSGYPDIETTLVNISIPTFANPTTVQSVNNWILFQQCLDNFNFNLPWSSYKQLDSVPARAVSGWDWRRSTK